jgi:hypothetical protein
MKTGIGNGRDAGSITMITALISICMQSIHTKALEISMHLGRKHIISSDIEYAILSEWIYPNSCYNELRFHMNSSMIEGIILEVPDKYKEHVRIFWQKYNQPIMDNIDNTRDISKICSSIFMSDTIFDEEYVNSEDEGYSDTENEDPLSYKDCICYNCKLLSGKTQYFYNLDPRTLNGIDSIMFDTFRDLIK